MRKMAEKNLTGSAKPGVVVGEKGGVIWGQEIDPFGGVDVLVEFVFYEFPLQSLPIDLRGFHCCSQERERE